MIFEPIPFPKQLLQLQRRSQSNGICANPENPYMS